MLNKSKEMFIIFDNETKGFLKPSYLSVSNSKASFLNSDEIDILAYHLYAFKTEEDAIKDAILQVKQKKMEIGQFFNLMIKKVTTGLLSEEVLENKFSFYIDELDTKSK